MSFGARGDGHTDDTAAIRRAIAALHPGMTLQFGSGKTFCHGEVLRVETAGVHLTGPGTLKATDEARSSVQIQAAEVLVTNLRLITPHTTRRWSTPDQHKLFLGAHEGITVRHVSIVGSAAAGLFCLGTSSFALYDVNVSDTRADGIHMTGGSHDGVVEAPSIMRSGDDGVAVVSYVDNDQPCRRITVTGPKVRTTTGGRGVSVVGGEWITYTDIDVDASSAAGVYVACEGTATHSYPSKHIMVRGGTVTRANTDPDIDHGAVLIYSGRRGGSVADVTISGLAIRETRPGASRQIGVVADDGDPVSNIRFTDVTMATDTPPPYEGNAPLSAVVVTNVTAGGSPLPTPLPTPS